MPHPFPIRVPLAMLMEMLTMRSALYRPNGAQARNSFPDTAKEAEILWPALSHLEATYPGFQGWYWGKVVPGLDNATRHIVHFGSVRAPLGVAILKRDESESKICTLWVAKSHRGKGVGHRLLEEAIDWVGVDRPLFTVPSERYEEFRPLMVRFGFEEAARIQSMYRPGVVEHVYNGQLLPSLAS